MGESVGGTAVSDEGIPFPEQFMLSEEKIEEIVGKVTEIAVDRFLTDKIQRKISKRLIEEIDQIDVDDVREIAMEVLGPKYGEIFEIAKSMREGAFSDLPTIDLAIQVLVGYSSPVGYAVAVLESQHSREWSKQVTQYKSEGATDMHARAMADVECSLIFRHMRILQNFRDDMREMINGLKRILDDYRFEWQNNNTGGTGHVVLHDAASRPWKAHEGSTGPSDAS